MIDKVPLAVWVIGLILVGIVAAYPVQRFGFGKAAVSGYWPRAVVFALLLGGGVSLILWKML